MGLDRASHFYINWLLKVLLSHCLEPRPFLAEEESAELTQPVSLWSSTGLPRWEERRREKKGGERERKERREERKGRKGKGGDLAQP